LFGGRTEFRYDAVMASAGDESSVRSTLGSYRLLGELGKDPLGVLHLACPAGASSFPNWAVVRRLHAGLARDPVMVHAFLGAVQAASRMVHPKIASTFDFGGKMDVPWSAREHLYGVTVSQIIARGCRENESLPWALAAHVVAEAAEGVHALRSRLPAYGPPVGFLTGAVTPSVFVTEAGEVKIVDGCLPLIDGHPLMDSEAIPYRPRSVEGAEVAAGRTDAFGLAVVLWELAAGRRLFAGGDDTESHRLVEASVVAPLARVARTPPVLDEIVRRALGLSPVSPIADARELAAELRAALDAGGARVAAEDVSRVVRASFASLLDQQHARVDAAWRTEQELQEMGDVPPDAPQEADVTLSNDMTVPDTTTETAVSRPSPFGLRDGFDEIPTLPRSSIRGVSSWRADAPSRRSLESAPRIGYLGDAPPPPSEPTPATPAPPPPVVYAAPAPLVLPPVERAHTAALAEPPSTGASASGVTRRMAPRRSLMATGIVGFTVAFVCIVLVGVCRRPPSDVEGVQPDVGGVPDAASVAAARPSSPPSSPSRNLPTSPSWSQRPPSAIPVASAGDLPRAPSNTPAPSRRGQSPTPSTMGRTGLLTVFCTPPCDRVWDGSRALGPSPVFKVPVAVGVHRLRLRVDSLGAEKAVTVTVRENDTAVVRETLGK